MLYSPVLAKAWVDLARPIDEETFAAIERAYAVIFCRDQHITPICREYRSYVFRPQNCGAVSKMFGATRSSADNRQIITILQ